MLRSLMKEIHYLLFPSLLYCVSEWFYLLCVRILLKYFEIALSDSIMGHFMSLVCSTIYSSRKQGSSCFIAYGEGERTAKAKECATLRLCVCQM